MSGNKAVASFEGRKVTPLIPSLVPLCFRNGGDLEWWLETRAIDKHRTNSRILKRLLRLSDKSDISTVLRVHGATITDNYWVKLDSDPGLTWEQVRFNSDYFADVAFRGDFASYTREFAEKERNSPTPELTNIGSYEKCWKLVDGKWVICKAGSPGELFSEEFAYHLGQYLGFNMAYYQAFDGCILSTDFTEGKYNFEPIANIVYDDDDPELSYTELEKLKPGLGKEFLDILFLDALVFNVDRHTFNYGVLRDQQTGDVLSMAPNYDNNLSLISRGAAGDPEHIANPLIDDFHALLYSIGVKYKVPDLTKHDIDRLVRIVSPQVTVDRDFAADFVWSNYKRL